MHFFDVASCFDEIERTSGRLAITHLLADLLRKATPSEASIICNLSLGQLNPPYIGTQFNIAGKSMIGIIANHVGITDEQAKSDVKKYGDLGSVLDAYAWIPSDNLNVKQVYKMLHDIEGMGGTGSQDEKARALTDLFEQLDPLSAKYVVRIIIGKLRLGFSDMTLVDALSWMEAGDKSLRPIIEGAYNVCADIGLIAHDLKRDGIEAIEKMKVHVGIPIRPAAAERLPTAKAIIEKIGDCSAQPKLDGFRLQIHLDKTHKKPRIHFYSRNLQDMSAMFPDIAQSLVELEVESIIFEGEAIVYDSNTGNFLPFQETVKRKRKHGIEKAQAELPLRVFAFDLLALNGKDMLGLTHEERRKKLLSVFKTCNDDRIQVIEEKEITTAKQLEEYFTANIAAGLEGLVVKRPDSIYRPGKRNFSWIKLKRQEEGHLEDTIDCVVLGYYNGKGKRASFGIGAFLVGVYNSKKDRFETVAKIGTGLKDEGWKNLKHRCDEIVAINRPKNVVCHKDLYPDVWVTPELVVLIRADEITLSPVHAAGKTDTQLGYALRFPRFMGYRDDKSADDATTAYEMKRLYEDQYALNT